MNRADWGTKLRRVWGSPNGCEWAWNKGPGSATHRSTMSSDLSVTEAGRVWGKPADAIGIWKEVRGGCRQLPAQAEGLGSEREMNAGSISWVDWSIQEGLRWVLGGMYDICEEWSRGEARRTWSAMASRSGRCSIQRWWGMERRRA